MPEICLEILLRCWWLAMGFSVVYLILGFGSHISAWRTRRRLDRWHRKRALRDEIDAIQRAQHKYERSLAGQIVQYPRITPRLPLFTRWPVTPYKMATGPTLVEYAYQGVVRKCWVQITHITGQRIQMQQRFPSFGGDGNAHLP